MSLGSRASSSFADDGGDAFSVLLIVDIGVSVVGFR